MAKSGGGGGGSGGLTWVVSSEVVFCCLCVFVLFLFTVPVCRGWVGFQAGKKLKAAVAKAALHCRSVRGYGARGVEVGGEEDSLRLAWALQENLQPCGGFSGARSCWEEVDL